MIVLDWVVNTPWGNCRNQRCLLCWKMCPVNKECRRWNPCCWCTNLLDRAFGVCFYRHKCTHVHIRIEHRPTCTTPVVRRCNQWIRCPNCPIRWDSRRRWFYLPWFERFLPSNLGRSRCHRNQIYRPGKSLRLLDRIGNTLLALECISSHWMPVGRNQDHNLCKL